MVSILLFAIALLPFDWEEYAEDQECTPARDGCRLVAQSWCALAANDWCTVRREMTAQIRAHKAKIATITLSGGAAVEKLYGTMRDVEMKLDIGAVRELLEDVAETNEELDLFIDRCWEQARRLVRKEWDAIKALAAALMERKTLSGEEVGGIIEQGIG